MSKKRANGEGSIRKRKDGRWDGRYTAGYDTNGKPITKNVLGKTQAEVKEKLHDRSLSPRMVQSVHAVLNKALEQAVEEKLILTNPAKKCKIPKTANRQMKILPEAMIGPYLFPSPRTGGMWDPDAFRNPRPLQRRLHAQHLCPLDAGHEAKRGGRDWRDNPKCDLNAQRKAAAAFCSRR